MARYRITRASSAYMYQIIDPASDRVIAVSRTLGEARNSAKIEATNRNGVYIAKLVQKIERVR